jgi:ribosomal protein S12 methylthiotransferase accessory factor
MKPGIEIRDAFKAYRHDQDKVRAPEQTLSWARERLSTLNLDILTRTVRIDTGRLGIPVYISLCGNDSSRFTGTRKQMGKGATPVQSEASAVMELLERYSFFSFVQTTDFPLYRYPEVPGSAVAVETLLQSIHDSSTPAGKCSAFLKDLPLRWVGCRNLSRRIHQWVPIDWFYLINEYNGPAAGNTIEEAVLQSLCEVVERHVGSIISHERKETPAIDIASLRDPVAIELVDKFKNQGIRLFLLDFSLDTGIPTVGALAFDPSTFPEKSEIVFTAGTTPNPEKSLCRALTEIAQLAGDFENRTSYRPTLPKYESLDEAAYLMQSARTISIAELPNLDHDNLRIEIERCVEALDRISLEVLSVNTTHPQLGIPAVYTIVPGAHFLDRTRNTDFAQHVARTMTRSLPEHENRKHMERLIDLFGPRYDLTFFLAHSMERNGETHAALALFREALRQDPDPRETASLHIHIGSCLKDMGDYSDALDALEKAEEFNPELKEIYNLRGFCHFKLKNHHDAIKAFEKAIELDPGSAIDYANIGSNLRELGYREEAVRLYKMALEIDPDIDFARENITRLEAELETGSGAA